MPELDDRGVLVATEDELAAREGDDHPARPPQHGRGHYRPDAPTPDEELEDELLEWVHAAAVTHNKTTTETTAVALDLEADEVLLTLRTGQLARVTVTVDELEVDEDQDDDAGDDEEDDDAEG